jgi:hypothetical protein
MDHNEVIPIGREDFGGEWSGLGAEDPNLLVTLRADLAGKTLLAVAREKGSSTISRVFELTDWHLTNGSFAARTIDGRVTLRGAACRRVGGYVWGRGTLTWDEVGEPRTTDLYLFHVPRASWMDRTLALARRYGFL